LKSSTFKLKKSTKINKAKTESNEKYCNYYFYEPNSEPKIFHLIFAKEGTEAGDYFNNETINYILNKANDITDKQSFDIINSIKDDFCSVSENILEERLKSEDLIIDKDQKIKLKITENKEKKIKLKRCLIDEIGFSNFLSNGFEPKYEYYITEDALIINLELPGDYEKTTIKKETEGTYTYIIIKGIKVNKKEKKDKKEYSFNNMEYGEFNITIKIDKITLESGKPEVKKAENNKGVTTFIYKLKKEEEETDF
jgi:HSP20 family molecular chaperone IbpA